MLLFCSIGTYASAQQRIDLGDGYTLVNGNGWSVLESDKQQRSIKLEVRKTEDSYGREVYNVLCNNTLVKTTAKAGLSAAIKAALNGAGIPIPSWVVGPAVSYIYDSICEYYE